MIWLAVALLAAIALAPLALSLRQTAAARGRQEAAIALHRAQLAELDRDLADGRIAAAEHANAVLRCSAGCWLSPAAPRWRRLAQPRQAFARLGRPRQECELELRHRKKRTL